MPGTLTVLFNRGFMGVRRREGRITIVSPGEVRVTGEQLARRQDSRVTLTGSWSDFPPGAVRSMAVTAHTFEDLARSVNPFNVEVNGAQEGRFSGEIAISPFCVRPRIRFDLNLLGGEVRRTDFYDIASRLDGDQGPVAPSVLSADRFLASIQKVTGGTHASRDLPVVVWFQADEAPAGTDSLCLSLKTEAGEHPQSTNVWKGAGVYGFPAHIWSGHAEILGRPEGANTGILTVLRAMSGTRRLAEHRESFNLSQVEDIPEKPR